MRDRSPRWLLWVVFFCFFCQVFLWERSLCLEERGERVLKVNMGEAMMTWWGQRETSEGQHVRVPDGVDLVAPAIRHRQFCQVLLRVPFHCLCLFQEKGRSTKPWWYQRFPFTDKTKEKRAKKGELRTSEDSGLLIAVYQITMFTD